MKETISKMKRQPSEWEEVLANEEGKQKQRKIYIKCLRKIILFCLLNY